MSLVRRWVHLPVPIPSARGVAAGAALGAVASLPLLRGWAMTAGASDAELVAAMPGDDVLPGAQVEATRGITILARPQSVWPWLVQLGHGRGGFYSFDRLENAVGLDIRSAERIEERCQGLTVGGRVHLAPEVTLRAVVVQAPRALVLRSHEAPGSRPAPFEFTWAFQLVPRPDGSTRLVVRERYERPARSAALVEVMQAASTVMTIGMLRGIRRRAEAQLPDASAPADTPAEDRDARTGKDGTTS